MGLGALARFAGCFAAAGLMVACGGAGAGPATVVLEVNTPVPTPTRMGGEAANSIPLPELVLSTEDVFQGGSILASVTGEITGGSITFMDRTYTLTQGARSLYTFIPIAIEDPAGPGTLHISFTLSNATEGSMTHEITVLQTEWTTDYLEFTPSANNSLLNPQVDAAEVELLRTVYSGHTNEKLWTEGWQVPVNAGISGRFGEQRSINGSDPSGHHLGTDFGAQEGDPVLATNSGRVVLARQLTIRGNYVIIDHGGGLFSGYGHLSAFSVAEGQAVEKGEVIGLVGNTGRSTAPHLHWEISQSGILVDAWRFADGTNGF